MYFTEQALSVGLSKIPEKNQLIVDYEDVCQNPTGFYKRLREKFFGNNYDLPEHVALPQEFIPSNKIRIPDTEFQRLKIAYEGFNESKS